MIIMDNLSLGEQLRYSNIFIGVIVVYLLYNYSSYRSLGT